MDSTEIITMLERIDDFTDDLKTDAGSEEEADILITALAKKGIIHTEKFTTKAQMGGDDWLGVKFNFKGWSVSLGPTFEAKHLDTKQLVSLEYTD